MSATGVSTRTLERISNAAGRDAISLLITLKVELSGSKIHLAHGPDLTRVDPRVARGSCDKAHILTYVGNSLTCAWCPDAIGIKANPVPVVSFDGRPDILVYAAVGAYAQIIDTTHRSGDTTLNAYDPKRPPGSRIVEVEVGGDPLDTGRTYRVAANDYMFGGGDGYQALARGEVVIDPSGGPLLASMVMDHIKQQREIAPRVEGRITRVN